MSKGLKYVRVKASEWMGLKIDAVFGPGMNVVTGANEQGKTRVLLALEALLGSRHWPEQALSKGALEGELTIDLGTDDDPCKYIVQWRMTKRGGMSLKGVTESDGTPVKEPQKFLNALCGQFLDPWEFMRMANSSSKVDRKAAVELFKGLMTVQCDIAEFVEQMGHSGVAQVKTLMTQYRESPLEFLKAYESLLMEIRKQWKATYDKNAKVYDHLLDEIPDHATLKEESVHGIMAEKKALMDLESLHCKTNEKLERMAEEVVKYERMLEDAKDALESARLEATKIPAFRQTDVDALDERIAKIEETNARAREASKVGIAKAEKEKSAKKVENLDDMVKKCRAKYESTLSTADIPVPGLVINGDQLYLDDLPLSQISKSEGLRRVSIPIGVRMKPGLQAFIIRDGDSMTKETRGIVKAACEEYGVQTILEIAAGTQAGVIELIDSVGGNGVKVKNGMATNANGDE